MVGEQCYHGNEEIPPLPSGSWYPMYLSSRQNCETCHEEKRRSSKFYIKMGYNPHPRDIKRKIIKTLPHRTNNNNPQRLLTILSLLFYFLLPSVAGEYVREFEVSEGVPVATKIGFIGHANPGQPPPPQPPYLIVPVPSSGDVDLRIEEDTGEIKTKVVLDRELRSSYSFVAIPHEGENIKVIIDVKDENDNAPKFPERVMHIPFPENTPRDVKKTLAPAIDKDLGLFNTQRYVIVSGNTNNAFRLSSHREDDGVLYLDLQVNGFLDRETTEFYSLVIEAWDEGNPPLKGSMIVNITIQDMNDNQPIFNQSRYFATIPENATIGTSVLQVLATDTDAGDNGKVTYSINRRQSDRDYMFQIDPKTGVISVNRPLDFEAKEVHELVVVARDNVEQPHETTAFVSIRIIDVNDNQPTINLIFLSDDVTPKISEDAQPGEYVARISVNDPDSKEKYANVNVTLEGGTGHFGLDTQDSTIYLMVVSKPLDREVQSNFTLVVVATDQGNPPLHASREFNLLVTDVNDNAPEFDRTVYYANVLEVADPGTSVFQLSALDRDEGNNSVISYSIRETPESHSNWFQIDSRNGLITTRTHIDCETDPQPQITVIATDAGSPSQSSSTTVRVTIRDVNDNEPIFDQSFYNVSVQESESKKTCILKVSATDPDCGVNAMVNYTFGERSKRFHEFEIRPISGDICITGRLDYEKRRVYEFPVVATDRGGLSTTAMVKIQLTDVNDNKPTFYPAQYNVSLREPHVSSSPVVVIVATDIDSGVYGQVVYEIVSGNDAGIFRLNEKTGELFVIRPLSKSTPMHILKVSARDGAGLASTENAVVSISVNDINQEPPIFDRPRYTFNARENSPSGTSVGTVSATSSARGGEIRYSIYSGDPSGYFKIDPRRGVLRSARSLDHEDQSFILLNVLATYGNPPTYGHTQVNISIWDVNDNAPEFDVGVVKISVPENVLLNEAIYAAHAVDRDSGDNGNVRYNLLRNPDKMFLVDEQGILKLKKQLDYESVQKYSLIVEAVDGGDPRMSSNLTINLEVQDVNDNPPVFEKTEYYISVLESVHVNSEFLQVTAVDRDTGNNARLTYSIKESEFENMFGVFPNSGSLYLKKSLDRESQDSYVLTVVATDNGIPISTASTTVTITVLDANDNTPMFDKQVYEFTIEENLGPGTKVGIVGAQDQDLGANASLRYSLASNSSFAINPITGEIVTRVVLDREFRAVYEVNVEVWDEGQPPLSARTTVRVLVTDVNDNSPTFAEPLEPSVSIREEQPIGTEVLLVRAMDKDEGNNASITYSLIGSEDADDDVGPFAINFTSGSVTTAKILDHEAKTVYKLVVQASDQGSPPKTATRTFTVVTLDRNDNRPTFSSSSFSFEVREGVKVGTEVGQVMAPDGAGGISGRVIYTIQSGNINDTFDINRASGQLFAAREIDYETVSEYTLKIRAVDSSSLGPKSSSILVKVSVLDINDQVPTFKEDPILLSISENLNIGSFVWNFTAVDLDSGANGEIKYSLTQQAPKKVFRLDPSTGILTLMTPLDSEEIQEFLLVVTATDQPLKEEERLRSSVTARILIEDYNDNSPTFVSKTRVDILEDEPVGFPVLHVRATDEDSGDNGNVTYVVNSGNDDAHFDMDYDTGMLTIAKPLDREITSQYRINITASDHGEPQKSAVQLIEVFILDVNDNTPKFSHNIYKANISESSSPGTYVTRVSASDKDHGSNGNLTYIIPAGIGDNKFRINPSTGEIKTIATLDREEKEEYSLTVYVRDGALPALYDTASVLVSLSDVNDHAPEFRDSCYPLRVPENTDLSVIHTVLATDRDSGLNGEVTYTILGGDFGHKFNIDSYSGQLSSKPLDREARGKYSLVIAAEDRGQPPQRGMCNITIIVEDQNDNDPQFTKKRYVVTVPENTPIDTTVAKVKAHDKDTGDNARITYSLNNETQWLFKINNETGVITTAGLLDREKQSSYTFEVRATDRGKYDTRSASAVVHITISDINDNRPVFTEFPFKVQVPLYHQPGQEIIKVLAHDKDKGINAEISYSLSPENTDSKFRIDPKTGIVTSVRQLSPDSGRVFHVGVVASDGGNPPQSASGLVEIHVGETTASASLRFRNASYSAPLLENARQGTDVAQVAAFRSDGRRQPVTYSFVSGNEYNIFELHSDTGRMSVKDSWKLDYETSSKIWLTVRAQTGDMPPLYAYTSVLVSLVDVNDNSPKFTQDQYVSSVWEGNSKGAYVTQVSATDADAGRNRNLIYDIIDGNHDNAFLIDPPFSGIVKTNIVLDREIRESYKLTIIATDEGSPQLTGTCTLRIGVVDVNDNQPTFPPHSIVEVSEDAEVGTLITTITANDVDTNPALTYNFARGGNPGDTFSIDKFSGKIILAKSLDHEKMDQYMLKVEASDTSHVAETSITVRVLDENDNAPLFSQQAYQVNLLESVPLGTSVLKVIATDADKALNAEIVYSLSSSPGGGFYINRDTGVIHTNASVGYNPRQPVTQLVVAARDRGTPSLGSLAAVRIHIADVNNNSPIFSRQTYRAKVREDAQLGHVILTVTANDEDESTYNGNVYYSIKSGNHGKVFRISSITGEISVVSKLDREIRARYELTVLAGDRGIPEPRKSTCKVLISLIDVNDHPPVFNQTEYRVEISETSKVGRVVGKVTASDKDDGDNAKITYDITSGNDREVFALDSETGVISLRELIDYDMISSYRFIVRAIDSNQGRPLSTLAPVYIAVKDENDNAPRFPVARYFEFIAENAPIGSTVFTAHANDLDKGFYGNLNYSIHSGEDRNKFHIEAQTGIVTTKVTFDYEVRQGYYFSIRVIDAGGKSSTVSVQVNVESRDEFAPVFSRPDYYFAVASNAEAGAILGQVSASDKDEGPDGRVFYLLRTSSNLFKINRTTGHIILRRQPTRNEGFKLEVEANSGLIGTLKSISVARISIGGENTTWDNNLLISDGQDSGGLASWAITLLIALIFLLLIFGGAILFLYRRNLKARKPKIADPFDTSFDTIATTPGDLSQYPPRYNDIRHYDHASRGHHHGNTTSEMSEQSQSTSSGRGSADDNEDVEDEEIRMINERPLTKEEKVRERHGIPSSGIHEDDNMSDVSVHNTQEYLARLGINTTKSESAKGSQDLSHSMTGINVFEHESVADGDGVDISNLIYSKLNEVSHEDDSSILEGSRGFGFGDESHPSMTGSLSSIVHSEEELQGSYNWDYLLDWGPQYQPLAHVFSEIARLKDDSVPSFPRELKKPPNPPPKNNPPPLLTSVAPRSIAPVALANPRTSQIAMMPSMPRSPISHESSFTSPAMSPSFSPALSPLATRSPSISPLVTPGSGGITMQTSASSTPHRSRGHLGTRQVPTGIMSVTCSSSESELRI